MGEAKVFEAGGFVVTTERFVYGPKVVPLEDISHAVPFVEHDWKTTAIIAAIGLAMLMWGGTLLKLIGLLCVVGAYRFFRWATKRKIVVGVSGEYLHLKVPTSEILHKLAGALNKQLQHRRDVRRDTLAEELRNLPTA